MTVVTGHSTGRRSVVNIDQFSKKSSIQTKLHFKMQSDTALLRSIQPGFLNLMVKIPFLAMLFLRKCFDKKSVFREAKISVGSSSLHSLP